ncbi:MAG: threonine aldolase [Planctomycetes bacterium]|nr:threonine aldolase [Planctomycetota bacterium]
MNSPASFGSDNQAPAHPSVLEALARANSGHTPSYGADPWTERAQELFRQHFGPHTRAFPLFNGTGANVLGLSSILRPHEAVLCARDAHVDVDEGGAPERFGGFKLVALPTQHGKIAPGSIEASLGYVGDPHRVQPRAVTISNATELGTVYGPGEIESLAETAHAHGLLLHMDGARICNAAVSLGLSFAEITTRVGVDVLSFGGTKNGLMGAEAVVFLREGLGEEFLFLRKQGMQLASKQRFLSAQLVALLEGELWRENAAHANSMAQRLAAAVARAPGLEIAEPVQANAVFARLPKATIGELQQRWPFLVWDEQANLVRWMCAWNTRAEDVDAFAADVHAVAGKFAR